MHGDFDGNGGNSKGWSICVTCVLDFGVGMIWWLQSRTQTFQFFYDTRTWDKETQNNKTLLSDPFIFVVALSLLEYRSLGLK